MRRILCILVLSALMILPARAQKALPDSTTTSIATVLASLVKQNILSLELQGFEIDYDRFAQDFATVLRGGDTGISPEEANEYISAKIDARRPAPAQVETVSLAEQQAFIDAVAAQEGAVRTPSGLVFIVLTEGEGEMPGPHDTVRVNYTGAFADGSTFDRTDNGPVEFPLDRLIPGYAEGIQMMRPGGTYRLVIPANLAYGEQGIPGAIPGNAALDFTVQLLEIIK